MININKSPIKIEKEFTSEYITLDSSKSKEETERNTSTKLK